MVAPGLPLSIVVLVVLNILLRPWQPGLGVDHSMRATCSTLTGPPHTPVVPPFPRSSGPMSAVRVASMLRTCSSAPTIRWGGGSPSRFFPGLLARPAAGLSLPARSRFMSSKGRRASRAPLAACCPPPPTSDGYTHMLLPPIQLALQPPPNPCHPRSSPPRARKENRA